MQELDECKQAIDRCRDGREIVALRDRYAWVRGRLAMRIYEVVTLVARRYRGRGLSRIELVEECFSGLLEAIDQFDIAGDVDLSTHAYRWVCERVHHAAELSPAGRLRVRRPRGLAAGRRKRRRSDDGRK